MARSKNGRTESLRGPRDFKAAHATAQRFDSKQSPMGSSLEMFVLIAFILDTSENSRKHDKSNHV